MAPTSIALLLTLGLSQFITGSLAAGPPSCPADTPLSCQGSTTTAGTDVSNCCINNPGRLLHTQFWWTQPSIGPKDAFTIHGLWTDNCDGSPHADCDSRRIYSDITQILQSQNRGELLSFMNQYWVDTHNNITGLWAHEWGKHGTCMNTIAPACYGSQYAPQEEVGDWFQKVTDIYKQRNTYAALQKAGITPGPAYDLGRMEDALKTIHDGKRAQVICQVNTTMMNEVYYYFILKGNGINGQYEAVDAPPSNCPGPNVEYPAKE